METQAHAPWVYICVCVCVCVCLKAGGSSGCAVSQGCFRFVFLRLRFSRTPQVPSWGGGGSVGERPWIHPSPY